MRTPETPERIRVFISSPGDVAEERSLTRRVIERLQGEFAGRVDLEPIYWEHEPLRATGSWHEQVFPPAEADIVLCILWSRLGTRQPAEITRPDGSRYDSGTEYEFEEAWRAHQERGQPDLLVYRKTKEPRVSLRDKAELMDRMGQKEALDRFIDTWFQDREEGTLIAAFHPFDSSHDFEELVEIHLRKLITERLPSAGATAERRLKVWTEGSPFRGLEAFEFAHAEIFSGRTRATSEVVDALRVQGAAGRPFVLVLGMSGCGKSSLVRAGVLPLLTQPGVIEGVGLWRRAIVRPSDGGGDPFVGLATALLDEHALPELGTDGTGPEQLAGLLRKSPEAAFALLKGGLSQAAAEVARAEELESQPEARLALVVDQLEELFTTEAIGEEDRRRFTEALQALTSSGKVWVLATLRSDFYPRLAELPALVELKEGGGQHDLLPPDPAEIGQMIRRPAQLAALGFEERQATGERLDDALRDAAARNPEALPLLQFTLEELYKARTTDGVLSFAAYDELGGVEGALAQRAERVLQDLPPEARAALPVALSRLVRVDADGADGATRQRARIEAFADGSPERLAVESFVEARLCVTDRDERGTAVVSLAHEALLQHWPRLRDWLEHNRELFRMRERLDAAAAQWQAEGRPSSSLLASGKRLAEAEELEAAEGIELPAREHAFLQASIAKGRRTRWLKRAAVAALAVLTVLAAAGSFYANTKRGEAEVARGESEAVTGFLSDMLASVDPEELGRDVLVKDVLDEASNRIDELEGQPLIQARLMNTMGSVYFDLGHYGPAQSLLEEGLGQRENLLSPEHLDVADSLTELGTLFWMTGEFEAARPLLERGAAIRESALPADDARLARSFHELASLHHRTGDIEGAVPLYERAMQLYERSAASSPRDVLKTMNNSALALKRLGELDAAQERFELAMTMVEKEFGPDHPMIGKALSNLGGLLGRRGERERARQMLERALAITKRAYGPEHENVAGNLTELGIFHAGAGEFELAEPLFQRALVIREKAFGHDNIAVGESIANLAILNAQTGRFEEARRLFERGLAIEEKHFGPEHHSLANELNNLANLNIDMGDPEAAKLLYERALAIREKALGPEAPDTAVSLNDLAKLHQRLGSFAEARSLFERALAIREKAFGPDDPRTARTLTDLAGLLVTTGEYGEARPLFERALAIQEEKLGSDHPAVATTLILMGRLYSQSEELGKAKEAIARAVQIREERLGPSHHHVAQALDRLALIHYLGGGYQEAVTFIDRAIAINMQSLGPGHPSVAGGYYNKSCFLALQGKPQEALETLRQAVENGYANSEAMQTDPDLASLHDDPVFDAIVSASAENRRKQAKA